jgi:hypothetical protein
MVQWTGLGTTKCSVPKLAGWQSIKGRIALAFF